MAADTVHCATILHRTRILTGVSEPGRFAIGADPLEIERLVRAHVERILPPGVRATVRALHGGMPWRASLSGPLYDAGRRALAKAFGREPVIVGEGGSIPVVHDFARVLGAPVLLMGFGLPGENAHAPNEWMSDENFVTGMQALAMFWDEVAA